MKLMLKATLFLFVACFFSAHGMNNQRNVFESYNNQRKKLLKDTIKSLEKSKNVFEKTIKNLDQLEKPQDLDLKTLSSDELALHLKKIVDYRENEENFNNLVEGYSITETLINDNQIQLDVVEKSIRDKSFSNLKNYRTPDRTITVAMLGFMLSAFIKIYYPEASDRIATFPLMIAAFFMVLDAFMTDRD